MFQVSQALASCHLFPALQNIAAGVASFFEHLRRKGEPASDRDGNPCIAQIAMMGPVSRRCFFRFGVFGSMCLSVLGRVLLMKKGSA